MAKIMTVRYERLFNYGNFEHMKFAVELALEEGETASEVMDQAKRFVRSQYYCAMSIMDKRKRCEDYKAELAKKDALFYTEQDRAKMLDFVQEFEAAAAGEKVDFRA